MLPRSLLLIFVFYLGFLSTSLAQQWIFPRQPRRAIIPFELINHVVLLPVQLNGENLTFILDTGVKETFLFAQVDSMVLHNPSLVSFNGLGNSAGLRGMLSKGNTLVLGDSLLVDPQHHLYVLIDSTINLSRNIGVPVHGVLGSAFFRNNVVRVDYRKKRLEVVFEREDLEVKLQKYEKIPISIINERPFLRVNLKASGYLHIDQLMLIDMGNSDPLMLFKERFNSFKLTLPYIRQYIGQGLNGDIFGYKSRIEQVSFGGFELFNPIILPRFQ